MGKFLLYSVKRNGHKFPCYSLIINILFRVFEFNENTKRHCSFQLSNVLKMRTDTGQPGYGQRPCILPGAQYKQIPVKGTQD